jgi:uncharacterized membrane protein YhaH (DUF805 family)
MQHYVSAFRRSFDYRGRARRTEYWMFVLIHVLVLVALGVLGSNVHEAFSVAFGVYFLVAAVPLIALAARRLHDVGYSGWLQLVNLLPFGSVAVLILMVLPGEPQPNRYGPPPMAGRAQDVRV